MMRPDAPTASRALTTRFMITCSRLPTSTLTLPSDGDSVSDSSRFSPTSRRIIVPMRCRTSLMSSTSGRTIFLRANASSCCVSAAPRFAASIAPARYSAAGDSGPASISASSMNPIIDVSRLLKSCATPPASLPMLSTFCDWRSCSSSCALARSASRRWLMSLAKPCHSVEPSGWVSGTALP